MATALIDTTHDCEHGGVVAHLDPADGALKPGGRIPVQARASSSCCGAILAEGGTDEAGYTCTSCGQPCAKVMGPRTASWHCLCGQPRKQVVTEPQDG